MTQDQTRATTALPHGFSFGAQQDEALTGVTRWLEAQGRGETAPLVYRLFGFAGTGKTTIARHLAAGVKGGVAFGAYTGKAALMMQRAGCPGAQTIHSLLYKVKMRDGKMRFQVDRQGALSRVKLIVIDECSMVDERVGRDLESFGLPILVLGDPAQLPPVSGKGYFTHGATPDSMLTEIHRQAKDNPIIRFATDVREGRGLPYGDFGEVVIDRAGRRGPGDVLEADQIIVGRNATRNAFNARIRTHKGLEDPFPAIGDRLVCLRNDMDTGILNGGLFEVEALRKARADNLVGLSVTSQDIAGSGPVSVQVRREFFDGGAGGLGFEELRDTQQFDYGYALTAHKAQGSQWGHVIAYDEGGTFKEDARRWLYTVITRASERLTLIR